MVFCRPDGTPLRPYIVSDAFKRAVEAASVGPCRFHDLRHTAATLALADGVPAKIVSDRLGHASSAFTMDTYGHVVPEMQEEAAAVVDEILAAVSTP